MKGKRRRACRSSVSAPSLSWISAAWTSTFSSKPCVSTRTWRLRPRTFFPASYPDGSIERPLLRRPWRSVRRGPLSSDWRRARSARGSRRKARRECRRWCRPTPRDRGSPKRRYAAGDRTGWRSTGNRSRARRRSRSRPYGYRPNAAGLLASATSTAFRKLTR